MALATLPPMYFFAHVYYSDIPSITMILLMILFSLKKFHKSSALFGAGSVLMRQTNIVWVAGTLGVHLVDKMMYKVYPKTRRQNATFGNFWFALKTHLNHPKILIGFIGGSIREFYGYMLIIIGFIVFLVKNGSIVGKLRCCRHNQLIKTSSDSFSWWQNRSRGNNSHPSAFLLQLVRTRLWNIFDHSSVPQNPQNLQKLEVHAQHSATFWCNLRRCPIQHPRASLLVGRQPSLHFLCMEPVLCSPRICPLRNYSTLHLRALHSFKFPRRFYRLQAFLRCVNRLDALSSTAHRSALLLDTISPAEVESNGSDEEVDVRWTSRQHRHQLPHVHNILQQKSSLERLRRGPANNLVKFTRKRKRKKLLSFVFRSFSFTWFLQSSV